MRLRALIAAYQAEGSVARVVAETRDLLDDVLVVDDGSSDATMQRARDAGARVERLPRHRGKGAALRRGFAAVVADGCAAVVTLDADGQHDPREIPRLVDTWRETRAALVIGSRLHLEDEMCGARRFGNRFARRALTHFAGVPVSDPQSGFRLYDARLLSAVDLRGERYEMESEVIVKAARGGHGVASVPVRLARVDGQGTSHFRPWRDTARICVAVLRSRYVG